MDFMDSLFTTSRMLRGQGIAARTVKFTSCLKNTMLTPKIVKLVSCKDGELQLKLFVNLSLLELYFEIK